MRKNLSLVLVLFAVLALTAGCRNKPPEIPAMPDGPDSVRVNTSATYRTFTTDPNGDQIRYIYDWADGSFDTTTFYVSGDTTTADHAWADTGSYAIKVLAEDDKGNLSADWSDSLIVHVGLTAGENTPPGAPSIPVGPDSGPVGTYAVFTTSATDPDGDLVRIKFFWDDGQSTGWSGPVASGETVTDSVNYINPGAKQIRALAMDADTTGDTSDAKFYYATDTAPPVPPTKPVLDGPARGIATHAGQGPWYRFTATASDPNGDSIQYKFIWGDGNSSDWTPFHASYFPATDSWRYDSEAAYDIRAIARDQGGAISDTSDSLTFTVIGESGILWAQTYGDRFTSSPALANVTTPGGETRLAAIVGSITGYLYAIDAYQGEEIYATWDVGFEEFNSSPAIADNGTVYIGNENGALIAFNTSGDSVWAYPLLPTGDEIGTTPVVDGNDAIYVGGEDKHVRKLHDHGATVTEDWSFPLTDELHSSPALTAAGKLIVADDSGYVYSLNTTTGTADWTCYLNADITSSPAIAGDGTIYVGTEQGVLWAISATGDSLWTYAITPLTAITSSPVIAADGSIYFGTDNGSLYRLNSSGTPPAGWPVAIGGTIGAAINSTPTLCADDVLYLTADDNKLYAIDIASHGIAWTRELIPTFTGHHPGRVRTTGVDDLFPSPAVDEYGIIYVTSSEDGIYAIAGRPGGTLAQSAWPMFHHDVRHTGKSNAW